MTQFLLHIGPMKTGTTYLQACFKASRGRLARAGVTYPREWSERSPGAHHGVLDHLTKENMSNLSEDLEELADFGQDRILISANLSKASEAQVKRLRDCIPSKSVKVIFYIRRWSGVLPSAWQQAVKGGYPRSLADYVKRHTSRPERSHVVNYELLLKAYIETFGMENLVLVSFDEVRAQKLDLFEHFAKVVLGIAEPPEVRERTPNLSRPAEASELNRALNRLALQDGRKLHKHISLLLDAHGNELGAKSLLDALSKYRTHITLDDAEAHLDKFHDHLATIYRSKLVAPLPPDRLFTPARVEVPLIDSSYQSDVVIGTQLSELYRELKCRSADTYYPVARAASGMTGSVRFRPDL